MLQGVIVAQEIPFESELPDHVQGQVLRIPLESPKKMLDHREHLVVEDGLDQGQGELRLHLTDAPDDVDAGRGVGEEAHHFLVRGLAVQNYGIRADPGRAGEIVVGRHLRAADREDGGLRGAGQSHGGPHV